MGGERLVGGLVALFLLAHPAPALAAAPPPALGHVHAYLEVRDHPTPVRYPGATATSRNGMPGVVLVDFIPGTGARPRWVGLR